MGDIRTEWKDFAGDLALRPVVIGVREAANYLRLQGVAGSFASTPDSAAVSVIADIDIRVKLAMDDWTPAAIAGLMDKRGGAGERSWYWRLVTTGFMDFRWSNDGTAETVIGATAAIAAADGQALWLRVTLDVNNGAGGNAIKFYTSSDGLLWTQLGATVTTAGVTSIFDSNAAVGVGNINPFPGKVYYAELRNGIDGPVVAKFDPSEAKPGAASFESHFTKETWTINGAAEIVEYLPRLEHTRQILEADDGLETAVIISLSTDRLANRGDAVPGDPNDRRGWWGDSFADVAGDRIGSRLWLLSREKQIPSVLARAREYAAEALQWLIDDGIARAVNVTAEVVSQGVLGLGVEVVRSGKPAAQYRFETFWKGA